MLFALVKKWGMLASRGVLDTASLILREAEFTHEGYMHQKEETVRHGKNGFQAQWLFVDCS